jgi:hypothetical protein
MRQRSALVQRPFPNCVAVIEQTAAAGNSCVVEQEMAATLPLSRRLVGAL